MINWIIRQIIIITGAMFGGWFGSAGTLVAAQVVAPRARTVAAVEEAAADAALARLAELAFMCAQDDEAMAALVMDESTPPELLELVVSARRRLSAGG